ncbi:hypothetical protein [Chitinophaga sp.]|uniref:hypothetical protein n=1 Tax=Chitinophaga sp. TaxID=1869181 RepID=UPI0031D1D296
MIIRGKRPFKQRTKQGMTLAPMKSGAFMLRMKSSLTGKRVKTDTAFKPLMEDAARMKVASPLAARVYRELEIGDVRIYRKMVGKAKELLKRMSEGEIECILRKEYGPVEVVKVSTGIVYPIIWEKNIVRLYHFSSFYKSSA